MPEVLRRAAHLDLPRRTALHQRPASTSRRAGSWSTTRSPSARRRAPSRSCTRASTCSTSVPSRCAIQSGSLRDEGWAPRRPQRVRRVRDLAAARRRGRPRRGRAGGGRLGRRPLRALAARRRPGRVRGPVPRRTWCWSAAGPGTRTPTAAQFDRAAERLPGRRARRRARGRARLAARRRLGRGRLRGPRDDPGLRPRSRRPRSRSPAIRPAGPETIPRVSRSRTLLGVFWIFAGTMHFVRAARVRGDRARVHPDQPRGRGQLERRGRDRRRADGAPRPRPAGSGAGG